eukprot:2025437-Amphidinium_carterae.1
MMCVTCVPMTTVHRDDDDDVTMVVVVGISLMTSSWIGRKGADTCDIGIMCGIDKVQSTQMNLPETFEL